MSFHQQPDGRIIERPGTLAERRAMLLHDAAVTEREADARENNPRHCPQPGFIADLRAMAARSRAEAAAIDTAPAQGELFA